MKRAFILLTTAILLLMAHSSLAQCPSGSDRNLILTEGMAEVTGQNDSAKISLAVVTEGRNLEQVSSENTAKTNVLNSAFAAIFLSSKFFLKVFSHSLL